jgi:STE24 endopeptidase
MNVFGIVILISLLLEFILELTGNLLNLRSLKLEVPAVLQDVYKPEEYRKSQEYLRVKTKFGILSSSFNLAVLLAFWFLRGFNRLDVVVRSWNLNQIESGLLYIGILVLAYSLLELPFSIYGTFVIEQRFGFNKTTGRLFVTDMVKNLLLGAVFGGALLAGVLAFFQYAGNYAWLYCWAGVVIFSLAFQFLAPTLIMPLFNKFTPMETGELREAILKYAGSVNFPLKNVFVMDGSKRSGKLNAFFTGFGRNKRIALFDTLVAQYSIPEIVGVLAHEVGHYKKKHVLQGMIISIIQTGVTFFILSLFIKSPGLYKAFYMENISIYSGLLFFILLYTPLQLVLSIVFQVVSRKNEYEADLFAAETIDKPQTMITALKKLSSKNLSNLTPHPFYVFLTYSHPPLLERITAIQKNTINDG